MSKIQVDTIDTRSGTSTLTLGSTNASTIALGSGDVQSNFLYPAFMVQLSANQSVGNSSWTKIVFNSEDWDTDSAFDTSTGRFTVPSGAAGKYTFYASLAVDSMTADKNVYVAFYKNGSHAQSGNNTPSVSTTISSSISASFDLSESDYIEVYTNQDSGGSKNYIGNSTTECLFYGYKQLGV